MLELLSKIKLFVKTKWDENKPMQGIILFMLTLFAANIIWKLSISGDEGSEMVKLFAFIDISAPFNAMTIHITEIVRFLLTMLGVEHHHHFANDICFPNHYHILVVWGCTAIKQSFIFLCIFAVAPGPWKHKSWYIPFGLGVVYFFNIFRITLICLIVENHPEYFTFMHEYLLKYLFYGVIFLVWMMWDQKFTNRDKLKVE